MKCRQIVFTAVNTAELLTTEIPDEPAPGRILVKTAYSTVSPGTERANITGSDTVAGVRPPEVKFPRQLGYSTAGEVVRIGENVTDLKIGDRVACFWTRHSDYNDISASQAVRIPDGMPFQNAAPLFIGTFPLAALRKTRLEIGESCLVMGLGLLGQYAVRLARLMGALPVIACDPVRERRDDALRGGADYAFDPLEPDFAARVKEASGGGVNTAVEGTGVGAGLDETLDCMARFGRIALLGCTRDKNFTIDYYRKVHCPGITLIGAHTNARPAYESHEHAFTHRDDLRTLIALVSSGRFDIASMLGPSYAPQECGHVYDMLVHDRNFPLMVEFDWGK